MFDWLKLFRSKKLSTPTRKRGRPKRPDSFDPSPKMVAHGTAFIVKLTMSIKMSRREYACINEQLIFSDKEVPNEQVLELPVVQEFLKSYPSGIIEKTTFECELKTVKNEPVKPTAK